MSAPRDRESELSPINRVEAFSDGVFAIAITLLIIEVKVPHGPEVGSRGLLFALMDLWSSYLGYVVSFLTLGIMWVNHHQMFEYIRSANRRLMLVHILFLMAVAFMPFPTAVLAEHLPRADTRLAATAFYGMCVFITILLFNAVWAAGIAGRDLVREDVSEARLLAITRHYRYAPLAYLLAAVLTIVNVWVSLLAHAALGIYYARSGPRG